MENNIKTIQDYFKNKLIGGEFKIKTISNHILVLSIDDNYDFTIWIGNLDIPESTNLWFDKYNFMDLNLSIKECVKLNSILVPHIDSYKRDVMLEQKIKELNDLKKELKIS